MRKSGLKDKILIVFNRLYAAICIGILVTAFSYLPVHADESMTDVEEVFDEDEHTEVSSDGCPEMDEWFEIGYNVMARRVAGENGYTLYINSKNGTMYEQSWLPGDFQSAYDDFKEIRFVEESGILYLPEDSSNLFSYLPVEKIDFSKFDTSKVVNMHGMFSGACLVNADFSSFDTSNVTDMSDMFKESSFDSLDLSSFDTSSVTDMSEMFFACAGLESLDLKNFDTSSVTDMSGMFCDCQGLKRLDLKSFDTSKVTNMSSMFEWCESLNSLDISSFDTSEVRDMSGMFHDCIELRSLDVSNFDTSNVSNMESMFYDCCFQKLDLSNFDTSNITNMDFMFSGENYHHWGYLDISGFEIPEWLFDETMRDSYLPDCISTLITPKSVKTPVKLPQSMYDERGNLYQEIPIGEKSFVLTLENPMIKDISRCSIGGFSLSYGYTGKAHTPTITVKDGGKTLEEHVDYVVQYADNIEPGTATITVMGMWDYTGTCTRTFEIVDCVSSVVSGRTYQLIPKNNSRTAVCSFGGGMINNTRVYITDRSGSEAMRFKAVKNSDGTWKLINAKCELALAVRQNSSEVGKGLVLYDQTTRKAQNWKLIKKSDNSFAITNAMTGYSIAMSDPSAKKGTTLSMAETASSGLQRFYLVETTPVKASYDGICAVKAAKNKKFALNIASSAKTDGASVNLYTYSNSNSKKFRILYSGGGYYRLVNVNSGLALTVKDNSKASGANVIQSRWAGKSGQRWKITKNADGSVTLTNALGTVLHLNGNQTKDSTNVVARAASSTTAQRWFLQR